MRALWLVERFPPQPGGVAAAAARRARTLAAACERLDVVRLQPGLPPGHVETEERGDLTVHTVGPAPRADRSARLLTIAATAVAQRHPPDLVHGFYGVPTGYLAVLLARELGLPSVLALRGNDMDLGMLSGTRQPLLSWALQHATAVTTVSRELARRVDVLVGARPGVHFIPNAVDGELFCPGPPDASDLALLAVHPRPWVGFSGELRLKKGLRSLQALAAALVDREDGTLFAVGGVRADERARMAQWRVHNPAASARLVEFPYRPRPEGLRSLLRAMDLLVFPSLWDGMPNAMLEAMACAKPVLAHGVGGIADAVQAGVSGELLDLLQLSRFPEGVLALLDRGPEHLQTLGQGARAAVLRRHTLADEREALLRVYREALDAHASPPAPA